MKQTHTRKWASCQFLLFHLWSMFVFCHQSSTQKSIMLNLFQLLQNPENYACTWEGVICTNNSVTQLHLTHSNYEISNSSVLSIACQIQSLQVLDVSNNYLADFITRCGKLPRLKSLDFSLNSISGKLPCFNKGGFTDLVSLDLSYNLLNVSIGSWFDGLVDLKSLNLSSNNLIGPIPSKDNNFYIGLYVSMGLGFYLGFWGVCGTLALKDSLRYAFFNFVDSVYNRIYVTIAIYVARFQRKSRT